MYVHKVIAHKVDKKLRPKRYIQTEEIKRWYQDGGDEHYRYTYPLTKSSIAIDAGAYEGEWSMKISDKYGCKVYAFEPITKYYEQTKKNLKNYKKVEVLHYGLGGETRTAKISLDGVTSSIFSEGKKQEKVKMMDVVEFCEAHKIKKIDLIKLNIEGGEYELLERIIDSGLVKSIDHIQVQFHNVIPDAEKRILELRGKLSKTHKPTYQYWLIWDNWQRKGL